MSLPQTFGIKGTNCIKNIFILHFVILAWPWLLEGDKNVQSRLSALLPNKKKKKIKKTNSVFLYKHMHIIIIQK